MLVALVGFFSASFVAGCSGGGGSPGSGATATPTLAPVSVTSRPLQNGDTFAYAGTTTKSFVYAGTSPEPQASTAYTIAQTVKISGPTNYDGASGLYDVNVAETDTSPLQTIGVTTDTYDALLTSGSTTDLVTYGFTSSDTLGDAMTVTLPNVGNGNGLLDELPEAKGQSWSNGPAETANETDADGQTSTRTVNADGSYTDTTTLPTGSIYPTAAPIFSQEVIQQNADGTGSYAFNYLTGSGGPAQTFETISVATPIPAASGQPALVPIAVAQPSASPLVVDVPLWYPQPLALYSETDTNAGTVAIPSACNVPTSFGKTANAVVQSITQVDTIVGTIEKFVQTNYVVPNDGVACVGLSESLQFYYDYSGQSGLGSGPTVDVSATQTFPIEIETIATTLGLTSASVSSAATARGTTPASASVSRAVRLTSARANFVAFVEREKQRRKALAMRRFLSALSERLHR